MWIKRDIQNPGNAHSIPCAGQNFKALYKGTSAATKGAKKFFQVFSGCRQGGIESPVIFKRYLDFVLRCAKHEILEKFPNNGLHYSYPIPGHFSTRQKRSLHGLSGVQRLRMLLYADNIVLVITILLNTRI